MSSSNAARLFCCGGGSGSCFGVDVRLPGGNQRPQPLRNVLSLIRQVVPLADVLRQIEHVAFGAINKQLPRSLTDGELPGVADREPEEQRAFDGGGPSF